MSLRNVASGIFFVIVILLVFLGWILLWCLRRFAYVGTDKERKQVLRELESIRPRFGDSFSDDEDFSRAAMASPGQGYVVGQILLSKERAIQKRRKNLLERAAKLKISSWRLLLVS